MNRETVEVFCALLKRGWIDRRENSLMWSSYDDIEVQEELENFKSVVGFDLFRSGDRVYMIPTQDNDLFLKNNIDYRKDIKATSEVRTRDLYLLNYLAVYLIYLFFNGDGNDPQCRDFITREDFLEKFTVHCKTVEKDGLDGESKKDDYSDNFVQLAKSWLSKTDGDAASAKYDCKNGILNRILLKFKADELFEEENGIIRPTRKTIDLMPYFLRKDRVSAIQKWIKEEQENASNQ